MKWTFILESLYVSEGIVALVEDYGKLLHFSSGEFPNTFNGAGYGCGE